MGTLLAVVIGVTVFVASFVAISLVLGMVSANSGAARLLVFVEPWRTIARWAIFSVSVWLGILTFAAF